jgi:hypothetical protein
VGIQRGVAAQDAIRAEEVFVEHIVTLETVGNGALLERFGVELEKVLENIADPNTEAEVVREILMKVKIQPDVRRNMVQMRLETSVKLAPYQAVSASAWMGKKQGERVLIESNPQQLALEMEGEDRQGPHESAAMFRASNRTDTTASPPPPSRE